MIHAGVADSRQWANEFDAGPSGLKLDVPSHPKAAEAENAYNEGSLDLVAELETQMWVDGMERTPSQVSEPIRKLAYQM
jgi:hypothetical protein